MTREIDLSALTSDQGFVLRDSVTGDGFGCCVASAGDLNGDGHDDLMIGAIGDDRGGAETGAVWVIFGSAGGATGPIDLDALTPAQGVVIRGPEAEARFGASLAAAGDVNGDGIDDIVIGAPRSDAGATDGGAAWVVFGAPDIGAGGPVDLAESPASRALRISGGGEADLAGSSVAAAGDLDGDGLADLLIGVPRADAGGTDSGAVWLIRGSAELSRLGQIALTALPAGLGQAIIGPADWDLLGLAVSQAGDLNGDGLGDLILAAPGRDVAGAGATGEDAGTAWVIFGSADPDRGPIDLSALTPGTGFALTGPGDGALAGWSVAALGDINGDGIDDIAIGAPYAQGTAPWSGGAWVVFGRDTGAGATPFGTLDLAALNPSEGFAITGAGSNDALGWAVSAAGDVNGDGLGDLVLGAPGRDGGTGAAWVIFGRNVAAGATPFGTLDLADLDGLDGLALIGWAGASAGISVAAAGDLNGDGLGDLLLGAPGAQGDPTAAGAAVVLYGGSFASRLSGSIGNDTLSGSTGDDAVLGFAGNDLLYGAAGLDALLGAAGDDTLDGGAGDDTLRGGAGDDTYVIDSETDTVCEFCTPEGTEDAGGADTVLARVSYDLTRCAGACYIETLILIGTGALSATGNALGNRLTGNEAANLLRGLEGADLLDGGGGDDRLEGGDGNDRLQGGAGADVMLGGAGNDVYTVESDADQVFDTLSETDLRDAGGIDTVLTSVSYSLAAPGRGFVERLVLTGTAAINATGNGLDNTLTGNGGANRLSGGAGSDVMIGGAGNDIYFVERSSDRVVETISESDLRDAGGIDTVMTSVSYGLTGATRAFVERLVLTGTAAINATGNALDNWLTGNGAANRLDGGAGKDLLLGGAGNDTYIVENAADRVVETISETDLRDAGGIDTVMTSVSYSLTGAAPRAFVERLVLTGTAAINGTGNGLANQISGNAGANRISGGLGLDTLSGGAGADSFVFDTAPAPDNLDRILDFNPLDDTLRFEDAVFAALVPGRVASGAFVINTTGLAQDADDRLIYESDTGRLFYDPNGTAAGGRVLVAILAPDLALTPADILIY
ncbi:FG-GAP repeat protein [Rhodobacter capsulatus]|uniref:FG-GAP repeat protein n=1 Tax=Rhodobacter capsulatus TaxID=1061 RepID=UPI0003D2F1A3|nr:FG-GAP repeat protein [Rhodobacter capsulatus]ETD86608.1 calcium-binding protein [Rhodobacter capsulatus B6]